MVIVLHALAALASIGLALLYLGLMPPSERIANERAVMTVGMLFAVFFAFWGMWRDAAVIQSTPEAITRQRRGAIFCGCYTAALLLIVEYKLIP